MSRFFSTKFSGLDPYTPGEQPQDMVYTKLNTNESPFPPCEAVVTAAREAAARLQLYPDPDCKALTAALAKACGVRPEQVIVNNGSDETLYFAFMAYCDQTHPAVFPDITYGFYPVFAELLGIPYSEIPLKDDLRIDLDRFCGAGATVFIANPNAPTGIALTTDEIERILRSNPDNVVVVDEAYVDFGAESAVRLTDRYDNLLVVQTFSKSRSLAGGRLGYGVGNEKLIADLNAIKYSTNPYNINRMTAAAGVASLENDEINKNNCLTVQNNRAYTVKALEALGFTCTPSLANFIFVKNEKINGKTLYLELKKRGVLIRHFEKDRIREYNRITIGSREQMDILLTKTKEILEELK